MNAGTGSLWQRNYADINILPDHDDIETESLLVYLALISFSIICKSSSLTPSTMWHIKGL